MGSDEPVKNDRMGVNEFRSPKPDERRPGALKEPHGPLLIILEDGEELQGQRWAHVAPVFQRGKGSPGKITDPYGSGSSQYKES